MASRTSRTGLPRSDSLGLRGLRQAALKREPAAHQGDVAEGLREVPELTTADGAPASLSSGPRRIPLGRLAQPEDIADVVVFLASGQNDCMTASSVFLDGGLMQGSVGL